MFPDSEFLLVDSISKKIRVVEDVLNQLNIKNAKGQNTRAENLNEKFDFIVSRAVAAFPIFYNWVNKNISKTNYNLLKNGILYLKGGDLREEMKEFSPHYMEFNLSEFFTEEFFETKKIIYLPKNRN
jgi:16S rRNA (guanine527-N7)-methyltransferase